MSNPEIFVSYDRKILISLCTVKNFQAHAGNYKQFKKMLCQLINKLILSLFKIKISGHMLVISGQVPEFFRIMEIF